MDSTLREIVWRVNTMIEGQSRSTDREIDEIKEACMEKWQDEGEG